MEAINSNFKTRKAVKIYTCTKTIYIHIDKHVEACS